MEEDCPAAPCSEAWRRAGRTAAPRAHTGGRLGRSYSPLTLKSSKRVWASDFVHRPTLPDRLNVSSVASRYFLPSKEHSIRSPVILTARVCQVPGRTFSPSFVASWVRLPATTLYSRKLSSRGFI